GEKQVSATGLGQAARAACADDVTAEDRRGSGAAADRNNVLRVVEVDAIGQGQRAVARALQGQGRRTKGASRGAPDNRRAGAAQVHGGVIRGGAEAAGSVRKLNRARSRPDGAGEVDTDFQ